MLYNFSRRVQNFLCVYSKKKVVNAPLGIFLLGLNLLLATCQTVESSKELNLQTYYKDWQHYLGDPARSHYSSLDQINRENVQQLEVAWTYNSEDHLDTDYMQCSPIVVHNTLFAVSPRLIVFAIDAATGEEKWTFNPFEGTEKKDFNRGVIYWENGEDQRILFTAHEFLYALNATTGKVISSFGNDGKVNLKQGLGREVENLNYSYHTPGTLYKDMIIMGSHLSERLPAAPGHIRAFDVRTGEQKWVFRTIPGPGEFGYDSWEDTTAYRNIGGANNWSGMSVDEERGIVYAPTGSAAFDFYGGNRKGDNLFANTLLALDAETGERLWHFQAVHHDLWDRDFPGPPNLVTLNHDGEEIPALAQITKSGHVYVLNRVTGEPLFPIEEKEYPTSDLIGEQTSPTQPLPLKPPPFSRQTFTEADINPNSVDKDSLLAVFQKIRKGGQFVPPSEEGTLIFPGFDGGGEWGGAGYDPVTDILYVNANEMPWVLTMVEVPEVKSGDQLALGKAVYQSNCMGCHGADLQGSTFHGDAPALVNLNQRLKADSVINIVHNGRGAMPPFSYLANDQIGAVANFLLNKKGEIQTQDVKTSKIGELRYNHTGYNRFVDSEGYPAIKPPWGTLNAIDLNKGELLWQVPLGGFEELAERGIPNSGTENYGGPVVTAGGLIFIGASVDGYFRAFDKTTGEEVWKYKLPAAGMATPCTYEVDGKQYIVVAAGGGKNTKLRGDAYVAFALPSSK